MYMNMWTQVFQNLLVRKEGKMEGRSRGKKEEISANRGKKNKKLTHNYIALTKRLLRFWTSSITQCFKKSKKYTQYFRKWICFHLPVKTWGSTCWAGPIRTSHSLSQSLCITFVYFQNTTHLTNPQKLEDLNVLHYHHNPIELLDTLTLI